MQHTTEAVVVAVFLEHQPPGHKAARDIKV
jgi:hypothetical protein